MSRFKCGSLLAIAIFLAGGIAKAQAPLTITTDGTLLLHDKPYRGIGANVADAFWRTLATPGDTSYEETFAALARHHIPFARIAACPFWPKDYAAYRADPEVYFQQLDGVIRSAKKNNVGLILSLHWATFAVPDAVGEPVNAWGRSGSKTIAFMRAYTQAIVKRYLNSPAVWAWELGNEFSLAADVEAKPPVVVDLGTPASRSAKDEVSTADMVVAWTEFGNVVRALDPVRPITTGNSLPRPPSEQLRLHKTWSPLDSRADMQANLALVTPSPINLISVHQYRDDVTVERFAVGYHATHDELVMLCAEAAANEKKALFVGEFGAPGSDASAHEQIEAMIASFLKNKVALAAAWNFDWRLDRGGGQDEWNITETNDRQFILGAIEAANATLAQENSTSN